MSADSDGQEFADSMVQVAKEEKWFIKKIVWLVGNDTLSVQNVVESVISQQSDVVLVHSRNRDNGALFRVLAESRNTTDSLWVITDVTEYGISNINILPDGLIKVSARKGNLDCSLYSDAIYDALLLFQTAFEKALGKGFHQTSEDTCFGENGDIQVKM